MSKVVNLAEYKRKREIEHHVVKCDPKSVKDERINNIERIKKDIKESNDAIISNLDRR